MCTVILNGILAQNADGPGRAVPQATPQIKALYEQQREMKAFGDVAGLEENRQAIIAAWQDVDPAIAAEFKPNQLINRKTILPKTIPITPKNTNNSTKPLWGDDIQLNSGFVDGVDIDKALNGTIYIAAYENKFRYGLGSDIITIYESTDNGNSFSSISGIGLGGHDITKIKLTIMDKGAEKGMFVTIRSADGSLLNSRNDMDGDPPGWILEVIAEDVKEFDIAVDYEFETTAQLYAVYTKESGDLYSTRTTANGLGLGWGDEHSFGYVAKECAITYGKENTFVSFVGLNSGNLYFVSNNGYNDPTGWNTRIDVTDGAITESIDISLSAERKEFSEYRALLLASQRPAGSTADYVGVANIVQGEIAFPDEIIGAGDVRTWDSWCRKEDGNTTIKTSYAKTDGDFVSVKNYHDTEWDDSVWISDNPITVQRGSSAVAEDTDGNAIAVYIGENRTGLYFDSDNPLGLEETTFNGFEFYPSPTSNFVNLKSESPISNVVIFNLLGQQVLNQKPDALTSEINVSSLSSGTYVMKVTIGNETGSYKIIKN